MINKIRLFTFFPRRFYSHYWISDGSLNFNTWWQWGRRCFFIRNKVIVRSNFSDWKQIKSRAGMNDPDACLIRHLIIRSNNSDLERFYNFMITETKTKEQTVNGRTFK